MGTVRGGESRILVVRGEPGVGKTALLDYVVEHASGCRVARVAGVQSELELAFGGVHQLCAPMLGRLQRLPTPQRAASRSAFGLGPGSAPDRFLVGLAVLNLLADVAEEHPVVCVVDDAQWLDQASAQILGFVARRLAAESVGLVLAARVPGEELAGLPELVVEGLHEGDARALLDAVLTGPLDAQVRDRIVAEARGNPLADVDRASLAGDPPPDGLAAEERRAYDQLIRTYGQVEYARFMGSRPQTLYGIADSPVGLAAWLLDHNDADGQPAAAVVSALDRTSSATGELTRDEVLDNFTLYWLTNTGVSASRLYWEYKGGFFNVKGVSIPVAVTVFPSEQYQAPRSWAERAYPNLIYYNQVDRGGHFAAWEQPQLFTEELRAAFRSLR
jgi:hypothetical protein